MYSIMYSKRAKNDIVKLKAAGLDKKAKNLIDLLRENPYQSPPSFEKLKGDLSGALSRRINIQHRLVYQVLEAEKTVKIIMMWTHYA
ncbi:MAG: Txe/YoeB family addiction module toxin [Betaproteobacteria bacterium]|nr:Txe/YoeB family addiction module toxin [Betaproteobacteria bacterium]